MTRFSCVQLERASVVSVQRRSVGPYERTSVMAPVNGSSPSVAVSPNRGDANIQPAPTATRTEQHAASHTETSEIVDRHTTS